MNDKRIIIGIAGLKHSGKDTVAKMIDYIIRNGVTKANYNGFAKTFNNKTKIPEKNDTIIHFADPLKELVSRMFGIDLWKLYDEDYKDNRIYLIDDGRFINKNDAIPNNYVRFEDRKNSSLSPLCTVYNNKVAISLRALIQYVGTNVCKNNIISSCWIRPTIDDAISTSNRFGYCIIPDVRFDDEIDAIKKQRGYVIQVTRPETNIGYLDDHISEQMLNSENFQFIINNDSTIFILFYKVKAILDEIYNN